MYDPYPTRAPEEGPSYFDSLDMGDTPRLRRAPRDADTPDATPADDWLFGPGGLLDAAPPNTTTP
jgi:hypothetical protein